MQDAQFLRNEAYQVRRSEETMPRKAAAGDFCDAIKK
jgi:hypothetical protein